MKIDLFVVGAQKAGTTAMHALLQTHPQICMATPKELHLFDRVQEPTDAEVDTVLARAFSASSHQTRIRGEATPSYCFVPAAIERIHAHNPDARIVMLLRHPAYRAFSHWRMEMARGCEHESFVRALGAAGRARMFKDAGAFRTYSYVDRGFYAAQVERLLRHFGAARCCFLRTDAMWNQPATAAAAVHGLLGLPGAPVQATRMVRPLPVDTSLFLPPEQYHVLLEQYRADILRTQALIGQSLDDWLDPAYSEPMRDSAVLHDRPERLAGAVER